VTYLTLSLHSEIATEQISTGHEK